MKGGAPCFLRENLWTRSCSNGSCDRMSLLFYTYIALYYGREQAADRFAGSANSAPAASSGIVHMRTYSQGPTQAQLCRISQLHARAKRAHTISVHVASERQLARRHALKKSAPLKVSIA